MFRREKKDVLLINPLLFPIEFETPLGLLYLATVLSDRGYCVRVFDCAFDRTYIRLRKELVKKKYRLIGVYSMSNFCASARKVAKIAKGYQPDAFVVMGGPHPTLTPKKVVENVDGVVVGEGERALLEIIDRLMIKKSFGSINNFFYKNESEIIKPKKVERMDVDKLPIPRREFLDIEKYKRSSQKLFGHSALSLIGSRGCAFNCEFCQPMLRRMFGEKVKFRNPKSIVEEMKYLKKNHGLSAVWFSDDTFTSNKRWVHEICDEIIKQGVNLKWSCNSRVDTVDDSLLRHMAEAGCIQIRYGVESGSEVVSNGSIGKKISNDKIRKAFGLADKHSINTWAYIMLGGPDETKETFEETKHLLREIEPVHIQLTMTAPLPGTRFRDRIREFNGLRLTEKLGRDMNLFRDSIIESEHISRKEIKKMYKQFRKEFKQYYPERVKNAFKAGA